MADVEIIARRYAAALADVVLKTGEADVVKDEVSQFATIIEANAKLFSALNSPLVSHAQKEEILERLIERSRPTKTTANFLRVLVRNARLAAISLISHRFAFELEERRNIVTAEIVSAREMPDGERSELKSELEKLTGKTVNMDYRVDEDLIGGVVTRIGSTVYDGSVRTKLNALKEQLAGA